MVSILITIGGSSFDALAMTLEQIDSTLESDELLRDVYDWNPYASAYALATCHASNSANVSKAMELAFLALLAERKWDSMDATAQLAIDALALYPSQEALSLLAASNRTELCWGRIAPIAEVDDLQSWFELFSLPDDSELPDEVVHQISDTDSLVGWTMANVIKRSRLSDRQTDFLKRLGADAEDPTIRWRAVHSLGSHPDKGTVQVLFEHLKEDQDNLVISGVIRSLVEIASLSAASLPRSHRCGVPGWARRF